MTDTGDLENACPDHEVARMDHDVDGPSRPEDPGADLAHRVGAISWYHSIDLGDGIVTPGNPVNEAMVRRGLPNVTGRSVLDVGAWDGFYSFLAERRGASRVVALDHYAWCVDFGARLEYWRQCEAAGELPDHRRDLTDFYQPDAMPGRRGFDLAHEVLASRVEPVVGDFMHLGPYELGRFDVVLFLGVLYHVREPLTALERIRALTGDVAVIETEAVCGRRVRNARLMEFHPGGELGGDHTNWFVPTESALHALCRAAGFRRVETRIGPTSPAHLLSAQARRAISRSSASERGPRGLHRYRIAVHAFP
jgi:tRNA (mo5U34)-methyltransferase